VSPVLWALFPHLRKVFEKNKRTFGNLFDTLNQYLVAGREAIALNRDYLAALVTMAGECLFATQPVVTVNNAEGSILLQLLFQVYAGTQVLHDSLPEILSIVFKRMAAPPMKDHL
jgi:hypothetical protein